MIGDLDVELVALYRVTWTDKAGVERSYEAAHRPKCKRTKDTETKRHEHVGELRITDVDAWLACAWCMKELMPAAHEIAAPLVESPPRPPAGDEPPGASERRDTDERPWETCERCNYDDHRCGGCGAEITHAEATKYGGCQACAAEHGPVGEPPDDQEPPEDDEAYFGPTPVRDVSRETSAPELPPGTAVMDRPNKYAGKCEACGSLVGEGSGLLARRRDAWLVVHRPGECQASSGRAGNEADQELGDGPLPDVPAGHYAVGDPLRFYRVDRPEDGKWAGRVFVKSIVGGHPGDRVARAKVRGVLARIVREGVVESARRYGTEIGRCSVCNRTLTDEDSRRLGIGPECRKKGA